MGSIWENELSNLEAISTLASKHGAQAELPVLIQQTFVSLQRQLLPEIKDIFHRNRGRNPLFVKLAEEFPVEAISVSNWSELSQGVNNLRMAMKLALPYYHPPVTAESSEEEPADLIIYVGRNLLPVIQQKDLGPRIQSLRDKIEGIYGLPFPQCRFSDHSGMEPHKYRIEIVGSSAEGTILAKQLLAISTSGAFPDVQGIECTDPIFGLPAKWINPLMEVQARQQKCIVLSSLGVLIAHLERNLRQKYHHFLNSEQLIALIKTRHDVASTFLKIPKSALLDIFRNCLRCQIPLDNFPLMLDKLFEIQEEAPEQVRENADYLFVALRLLFPPRTLTKQFGTGKFNAISFTDQTSNALLRLLDIEESNIYLQAHAQTIIRSIAQHYIQTRSLSPLVICPDYVLPPLLRQCERNGLSIPLVMASEIPEHVQVDQCIEPIHLHELI